MRYAALALCVFLMGCDIPRDPSGTLERVHAGTMHAGFGEASPWISTDASSEPRGIEAALIRQFAASHGARVVWHRSSCEEALRALEAGSLDLVSCGLTDDTPWKHRVGLTKPYFTTRYFVGFPAGRNPEEELDGLEVAVMEGSWLTEPLRKAGATPVPVSRPFPAGMPMLAAEWELRARGYERPPQPLVETRHVMAVHAGENAFLVSLENFLLSRSAAALMTSSEIEP